MAMKYWSSSRPRPPPPPPPEKKIHVKVKSVKLEGLHQISIFHKNKKNPIMVVAMKWRQGSSSSSSKLSRSRKNFSTRTHVRNGEASSIKWDDEFENISAVQNDMSDRWDVSFSVLYGENNETNNNKLAILGKVSLNLVEIAAAASSMMEAWIDRKIPINLKIAGVTTEATLTVSMNFVEIRNFKDSSKIIHQNLTETNKEDGFGFFSWMTGYIPSKKNKLRTENKKTATQQNNKVSSCDSDESATFDSVHNMVENKSSTQVNQIQNIGFLKRRRLSFGQTRTKRKQPDIEKIDNDGKAVDTHLQHSSSSSVDSLASVSRQELNETETCSLKSDYKDENCTTASTSSSWEVQEIISRDGLTKLKTNVFFASFDQCSQEAAGESACTSLAAVIAHWLLQSNQQALMPTRSEFDTLITDGSSEWRKLCDNIKAVDPTNCCFQDKHFDLETVLEAGHLMRPLHIVPEKSFIGFFSPEKFESLKGAMSFDEIWNEIDTNIMEKYEQPRIYIVSWNDHFFVLKVEADACYIIDTLGERLFEGCKKGYMLKFDDSSALMYNGNAEKEQSCSGEIVEIDTTNDKGGKDKIICTGRECCREFIKRFLAAIPVKELEEEQKKGTFSNLYLLQHLQIEFQYTSSSAASSSSSSSSSSSPSPATSSMSSLFCITHSSSKVVK